MEKKLISSLVRMVAHNDYMELCKVVGNKNFENALKALDGFNLSVENCTCNGTLIGTDVFFDFNFRSLNGTIFRTPKGGCEIHEVFDVWLNDFATPIANVLISSEGEVDVEKVLL